MATSSTTLINQLHQQGFLHVDSGSILGKYCNSSEFQQFQRSWNDLPEDNHLLDNGHYRFRRYAVFTSIDGVLSKLPKEPHYQPRKYNHLHGGINRYFEELTPASIESPVFKQVINWNLGIISTKKYSNWRIQCHQFRICANQFERGKPAPEGIHQDGSNYVFIMLLGRNNVQGAENTIHNKQGEILYRTTLQTPGEALLVDDKRHWHGVSEIVPEDKNQQGIRDVLVFTFHAI